MKNQTPAVSGIVVLGHFQFNHVTGATNYGLTIVNRSNETVAEGEYVPSASSGQGSTLTPLFTNFMFKRGMKMEAGEYTIKVIAKSPGNEDSEPGEGTFKINQAEADAFNRLLKKPFPWVKLVIGLVLLAGLLWGAVWLCNNHDAGNSAEVQNLKGELQQLKHERDKLQAAAKVSPTNASPSLAPSATNSNVVAVAETPTQDVVPAATPTNDVPEAVTNSPAGASQVITGQKGSGPVHQTVNVPPNSKVRVKTGNMEVGGNNYGPIVNSTLYITEVVGGHVDTGHSHDHKQAVTLPPCKKTGWLGENRPTSMHVIPDGVMSGVTNFAIRAGEKLMLCVPANVTFYPDPNDASRFVIKYGDDCGKQGDYGDPFGPGEVIPQVHGCVRVLIEPRKVEKAKGFEFSILNFSWGPRPPRSTP